MQSNHVASGETALAEVIRGMVRKRVKRARKRTRAVLAGADPEAVHDLRGDIRRLRTMLRMVLVAPGSHPRRLRRALNELDALADRLGVVRDLDVLLANMHAFSDAHAADAHAADAHAADAHGLSGLEAALQRQHARARKRLKRALRGARKRHVWRMVRRSVALRAGTGDAPTAVLVRHFAGSALWGRYETLLGFEARMATPGAAMLHRLRIACKKLNTTIEVFAEALGPEAQTAMDLLAEAQHHLGALHDDEVALERVDALRGTPGKHGKHGKHGRHGKHGHTAANGGLGAYAAARVADRERLCVGFLPLWARLSAPAFRLALARMIAGL